MDLQHLCTNCLMGTIRNGTCTCCKKKINDYSKRTSVALPDRYMLAGQYYLGRVIGNGGFGITYLAWDCIEKRRLIVKELYPRRDVERDPVTGMVNPVPGQEKFFEDCKIRFREEAKILHDFCNEPSVVDVYRLMQENNTVYYSMELLSGYDLRAYIEQKGQMDWDHLSGCVKSVLRTLRILHGKNLIHRDISPDNIFLTAVSEAKLIDFGSVRFYNSDRALTVILKQVYAPIEQYYSNGSQGPWTDIYSLSTTMYHALSSQKPPSAPDRFMKKKDIAPIESFCPELPAHVARAITKGMSIQASDRYPNVEEMACDLFPGENIFEVSGRRESRRNGKDGGREPAVHIGERAAEAALFKIRAQAGLHMGQVLPVLSGDVFTFGRDKQCSVNYPPSAPGVSRRQFTLRCEGTALLIQDEHSSYGTFVSGYRLQPGQWYRIEKGSVISFAGEGERYYVE